MFMGFFSKAAHSAVPRRILLNSKPTKALIVVLITCKNEGDTIKKKAPEYSHYYALIFQMLKAAN